MSFIDVHIIQTVPYANLNRDDLGTPKTVSYGGMVRARVSSQSWKRAARHRLENLLLSAKTYRTRNPHLQLAATLMDKDSGVSTESAGQIATNIFSLLGTGKTSGDGSVILFVGKDELNDLAALALQYKDSLDVAPGKKGELDVDVDVSKALKACLVIPRPTSVALFGRMLAATPEINVDASMQVAHALSVHPVDVETDFFTAAEDIPTETDLTGGAHMGSGEFVSATFYRYATINMRELIENCGGDVEVAEELARLAIASLCLSLPTGKNNATAPHTLPSLVNIVVRENRPVSYAAAFEAPALRSREGGYTTDALRKLAEYSSQIEKMVSENPLLDGYVQIGEALDSSLGGEYENLDTLVSDAVHIACPLAGGDT